MVDPKAKSGGNKPRSEYNQSMIDTLFLDGANATYIEQIQAQYAANPNSVDPSWRAYFASVGEEAANSQKTAEGPSWNRPAWPPEPNGELTSALTGDWGEDAATEKKVASHMTCLLYTSDAADE